MAKKNNQEAFSQMYLAKALEREVQCYMEGLLMRILGFLIIYIITG